MDRSIARLDQFENTEADAGWGRHRSVLLSTSMQRLELQELHLVRHNIVFIETRHHSSIPYIFVHRNSCLARLKIGRSSDGGRQLVQAGTHKLNTQSKSGKP